MTNQKLGRSDILYRSKSSKTSQK